MTLEKTLEEPLEEIRWSYDFNHEKARVMYFNDWVKTHICLAPGAFTSVKDLYAAYKRNTSDPNALITEDLFYKEIEPVMFGLNIKPGPEENRAEGF